LDKLLRILKATADPSRIRLLILCAHGEFTVSELVQVIGQSQPRVSRHLKILCDAGLLQRTQQGNWAFYRSFSKGVEAEFLLRLTALIPAKDPTIQLDQQRLMKLKNDRLQAATLYFQENASDWDSIRALHVDDVNIERELQKCVVAAKPRKLLDIGTGTGRILKVLGPCVQDAEGIDFSHEMLNLARVNLDDPSLRHCRVRHGDMYQLPYQDQFFDYITIHQVLHFIDQPQLVLKEATRVLKNGGQIAIIDFYSHEREELRTKYRHRRLGFSNDEIENWLDQVGLGMKRTIRLGGGPLAVVIWTGVTSKEREKY
jgi:ArsR family transcriptional regulator